MSGNFLNAISNKNNEEKTMNGANALRSTGSDLVNLFGSIGAMRERLDEVESKFIKAFHEDKLLATKMAFYARNPRGGLGERDVFRSILRYLGKNQPEIVKKNLELIPELGRWDDLLSLIGTEVEEDMVSFIKKTLKSDKKTETPTLCAKWMPSINSKSIKTKKKAKFLVNAFGWTERKYRKRLSKLRAKIRIVETMMSQGKWSDIDYSKVPSRSMNIYRNAFDRNDQKRFLEFKDSLLKGETTINAGTLYPYDIVEKMSTSTYSGFSLSSKAKYDTILEAQWKALPNYVEGENNIMIMADTSASMNGRPMATAVGLAMYFAERNNGAYKNTFMTFSEKPELVKFRDGMTVADRINSIKSIVANTDLEKAFDLILDSAIQGNISQEEMPKSLVVISDMQFDEATSTGYGWRGEARKTSKYKTLFEKMEQKFSDAGYKVPNCVFWNVASPKDTFQVTSEYKGIQMASGQSASVFKSIIANIGKTPYQAMVDTLNDPSYDKIKI